MSDLVVLAFKGEGAARFSSDITRMQEMQILQLDDAAIVIRNADGKAKVKEAHNLVGANAFGGASWGVLIGLLFWSPWLGLAIGAISGALAGKFSDIGIDDNFIKQVSQEITPGTSAIFLLVRGSTPDRVLDELWTHSDITVLQTSLSRETEERLREALATPSRVKSMERVA